MNTLWTFVQSPPIWVAGVLYLVALTAFVWTMRGAIIAFDKVARSIIARRSPNATVAGARLYYLAGIAGMGVSVDTSWNFFGSVLHVDNLYVRGVIFFVLEIAQVACARGMQVSMREHNKPGPARWVAWALCAMCAYMAYFVSGFFLGIARVVAGPVLSLVMLHLALGIEGRKFHVRSDSTVVVVLRELRQRFLAMLGLGDEGRDAKAMICEKHAMKAFQIHMTGDNSPKSQRRFVEHLSKADLPNNPALRDKFIDMMRLSSNVKKIHDADYQMPDAFREAFESATESPAPTSVESESVARTESESTTLTETPAITAGESESVVESESDVPGDSETPDDSETPGESASLTITNRQKRNQIEVDELVKLMIERGGSKKVTVEDAKEVTGKAQATAFRRLAAARELYDALEAS